MLRLFLESSSASYSCGAILVAQPLVTWFSLSANWASIPHPQRTAPWTILCYRTWILRARKSRDGCQLDGDVGAFLAELHFPLHGLAAESLFSKYS